MTLEEFYHAGLDEIYECLLQLEIEGIFDIESNINKVFDEPLSISYFVGEFSQKYEFQINDELIFNLIEADLTIKEFLTGLFSLYYKQKRVLCVHEPEMKQSKIIQLLEFNNSMYALCDDGSVWERYYDSWIQILDEEAYLFDD